MFEIESASDSIWHQRRARISIGNVLVAEKHRPDGDQHNDPETDEDEASASGGIIPVVGRRRTSGILDLISDPAMIQGMIDAFHMAFPAVGQAATHFLDSPTFLQALQQVADTAGLDIRTFLMENWDNLSSTFENVRTVLEESGHMGNRQAGDGGVHGPYHITDDNNVVNSLGETKGKHDNYEDARDQQKALYVNVPEAQEQAKHSRRRAKDNTDSTGTGRPDWLDDKINGTDDDDDDQTKESRRRYYESEYPEDFGAHDNYNPFDDDEPLDPPHTDKMPQPDMKGIGNPERKKSGRRRLPQEHVATQEATFSPPKGPSGSWSCNTCGKDGMGVHDLNGHAAAHLETNPVEGPQNKKSSVDPDPDWALFF